MAAKAKGLGKGLGSLLGDVADLGKNRVTVEKNEETSGNGEKLVKIRLVEPNREQPRKVFKEEDLKELADSIRIHGVIQPLIVVKKGERYEIVAGERRWRAAKLAGLKEIPVLEREFSEKEKAEISLIENIQRRDLNPIEEALAYDRLLTEFDMTQEELGERVSKSRTSITNSLRLLKLPTQIQKMLSANEISTGHAKVLLGVQDQEKAIEIAKEIANKHLSVRETEKRIASLGKEEKQRKELQYQAEYRAVEDKLSEKLGTRVTIKRRTNDSGKLEIEYFSLEDIERIIAHIK